MTLQGILSDNLFLFKPHSPYLKYFLMLNLIVNESINKDTPAQYQVATDVILTHNTSILCEHWFKEKGIIEIFLSLLIIIMC